jgi:hypothetical protein
MIAAAGVDTWSVAWYAAEGSTTHRAAEALCIQPSARGRVMKEKVNGHVIGWMPHQNMLYAEGHPADLGGLARADSLPEAFSRLVEAIEDYGVLPPRYGNAIALHGPDERMRRAFGGTGFAGVRRLDATADMYFEQSAEGLASLAGVAALPVPRVVSDIWRNPGETSVRAVFYRGLSGKRILGRWYDKGVETREMVKGRWIRPEAQWRFPKSARPTLESVSDPKGLRNLFVGRFQTLYQASKGITVGTPIELAIRLKEMQEDGEITPAAAERMAGFLVLDTVGGHNISKGKLASDRTLERRRAEARRHGLVTANGVSDPVEINLSEVIEQALDSECWGAEG